MADTCRSCNAPIAWTITERGRRMPVDAQKVIGGNLRLEVDPTGGPPRSIVVGPGQGEFVSHFVTCPDARDFRRKR